MPPRRLWQSRHDHRIVRLQNRVIVVLEFASKVHRFTVGSGMIGPAVFAAHGRTRYKVLCLVVLVLVPRQEFGPVVVEIQTAPSDLATETCTARAKFVDDVQDR